jgi:hypothetical protein
MKTKPIDHDESTYARQQSYHYGQQGLSGIALAYSKKADALEAKEPLAWQPAGTISIRNLLNPKNTK